MEKLVKKILSFTLCLVLMAALFPSMEGQALAAAVKLDKTSITLSIKQQAAIKMLGTTKKVTWSSSNDSVASVSAGGVVTAKKQGTATITGKVSKKKYTCKITVKGNWKQLYKAKLASDSYASWYYVKDLNKDGLPDLVTTGTPGGVTSYNVYTIKNGKVVLAGSCNARGISIEPYFMYVPKYKGLYMSGWTNGNGGSWGNLFVLSGTKLVQKYHAREGHYPSSEYYTGTTDTKCKKVSKASYTAFCKKYFGSAKKFYMKSNTAVNRTKSFG